MSPANHGGLRRTYVETSLLIAAVLEGDARAYEELDTPGQRFTSALTAAEARRAVTRARVRERINTDQERAALVALEAFIGRCDVTAITSEILLRAGQRFPIEPVRTLDAIHLATVESVGIPPHLVRVITRDRRVRENALAMGYTVN